MFYIELNQHLEPTPDDLFQIAEDIKAGKKRSTFPVEWELSPEERSIDELDNRIMVLEEEVEDQEDTISRLEDRIDELTDTIEDRDKEIEELNTKLQSYEA